jgi:hypothetical protein
VRIIPFEAAHAEEILAGNLNDERNRPAAQFGDFIPGLVVEDMAFTGVDNGYIIGAAGIYPLWQGVGEAWFIGADRATKNKTAVARAVRDGLYAIAADKKLRRVQAAMRSDWPHLARWARYLGMSHEGSMRLYGADGSDYERWAWIDGR